MMANKLKVSDFFEKHKGEKHIVVLHEFPDSDAIASAFTQRLISAEYDIEVSILYSGKISHRQNIALVKLMGIDLIPYDKNIDFKQFNGAVFLDNQGTTVEEIVTALEDAKVPVLLIIDHHEPQERLSPEFSDIQRVGATATIFTKYIEQGIIQLDKANKEHVIAATALTHGILTDTASFIRANAEDFNAAAYLSRFRDPDLLSQIMSQSRSKQVMEIIRRALGDRVVVENYSIAGIGYLRSEDRDAIPQAAEFLLSEENVHTSIVYGIMRDSDQDETLVGSMRTAKITIDPDDFIKEVFGKNLGGRYYGGGKISAGGFSIPVGFLVGEYNEKYLDLKWQVYDTQVKYKLFSKIGVKRDLLAG